MPLFDLHDGSGALDPLAPFKVLAVMCHPNSRVGRERMMAHVQKETGEGKPRRRPLSSEEFMTEVRRVRMRAAVAGGLLLTMIQLHANGCGGSLNHAAPLVADLLPKWQNPEGPYWSKTCHFEHHPHSRRKMLKAYRDFRSVAHLWAALLHGEQHGRADIWPGTNSTLPVFIGYSEAVLDLACKIPSPVRGRRFALSRSEAWRFTLPAVPLVTLAGLPLRPEQQSVLNEHSRRNVLI